MTKFRTFSISLVAAIAISIVASSAASAYTVSSIPLTNSSGWITASGGGSAWINQAVYPHGHYDPGVARISSSGVQTSFPLTSARNVSTSDAPPIAYRAGAAWAVAFRPKQNGDATIFKVSGSGKVSAFRIKGFRSVNGMVAGPGGVWVFGGDRKRIAIVSNQGKVKFLAFRGANRLLALAAGTRSTMWATDAKHVFRISADGAVKTFRAPAGALGDLATDRSGSVWVPAGSSIVRISPSGGRHTVAIKNTGTAANPRFVIAIARASNERMAYVAATMNDYPSEGGRVEQPSFGIIDSAGNGSETPPSALLPLLAAPTDFDLLMPDANEKPVEIEPGAKRLVPGATGSFWFRGADSLWKISE